MNGPMSAPAPRGGRGLVVQLTMSPSLTETAAAPRAACLALAMVARDG